MALATCATPNGTLENGHGLISYCCRDRWARTCWRSCSTGLNPTNPGGWGWKKVTRHRREPCASARSRARWQWPRYCWPVGPTRLTNVYAATSAMCRTCKKRDEAMMALLETHGGRLTAVAVAELGLVEHAERLLAEAAEGRTPRASLDRSRPSRRISSGAPSRAPHLRSCTLALGQPAGRGRPAMARYSGDGLDPASGQRPASSPRCSVWCSTVRSERATASERATLVHDIAVSRGGGLRPAIGSPIRPAPRPWRAPRLP